LNGFSVAVQARLRRIAIARHLGLRLLPDLPFFAHAPEPHGTIIRQHVTIPPGAAPSSISRLPCNRVQLLQAQADLGLLMLSGLLALLQQFKLLCDDALVFLDRQTRRSRRFQRHLDLVQFHQALLQDIESCAVLPVDNWLSACSSAETDVQLLTKLLPASSVLDLLALPVA